MENTLENKAKFFAQYWGQNVLTRPKSGYKKWVLGDEVSIHSTLSKTGYDYQYILELKPLSSITDEDLKNIVEFYESNAFNIKADNHYGQIYFDCHEGDEIESYAVDFLEGYAMDYLRANGFACPYLGLSIEKQIEYGWIKLKSE